MLLRRSTSSVLEGVERALKYVFEREYAWVNTTPS